MAFDLNPVAVTAAPLLRAIDAGNWNTRTELAEAAGRKPSNIARDLAILVNAALVEERAKDDCGKPIVLTEEGVAQLAALDRANGSGSAGALTALHSDIAPHPLNPRKDFETAEAEEGLDELRVSIVKKGLLQPIVVRPQPEAGKWWIVAGERRWRAIGQAISDGDWNDDQPIEIAVREVDDREHLLLALNENLQRSNMKAIEEGVAFAAAVHEFGLSTEELSNQTGKSQRYVQQRIALLKLSQPDQDRMRLPKDHPDFLSFKAARAMTQTAREPATPRRSPDELQDFVKAVQGKVWVDFNVRVPNDQLRNVEAFGVNGETVEAVVDRLALSEGWTTARAGEPGSPPPEPADSDQPDRVDFDSQISDREALLLVEIADKADRQPDELFGSEHYTRVQSVAAQGNAKGLIDKGLVGFRQRGMEVLIRPKLFSTGMKAWLEGLGFYGPSRADVLFEMRARVHGAEVARTLAEQGVYATGWLNPAGDPPANADGSRPSASGLGAAHAAEVAKAAPRDDSEPTQPDLIEESPEEREARERRQAEAEALTATQAVADAHARRIADWMNFARFRRGEGIAADATDYLTTGEPLSPEDLSVALYRALATGALTEAGVILAVLQKRGDNVARPTLEQMPVALIAEVVEAARAPAPEEDAD